MPECGIAVEGNIVAYPCTLEQGHAGPCLATENARSVRERKRWESAQKLEQFQGKAETTAERYTINATPVPGSEPEPKPEPEPESKQEEMTPRDLHYDPNVIIDDPVKEQPLEEKKQRTTWEDFQPGGRLNPHPTKTRPGDQRLPDVNDDEYVQQRIIQKLDWMVENDLLSESDRDRLAGIMIDSIQVGIERYGTGLQTFNGRDTLQDAEDEARDLLVYISALNQARSQDREHAIQSAIDAVYQRWYEQEGDSAMAVDEIVHIAVNHVLDATGL